MYMYANYLHIYMYMHTYHAWLNSAVVALISDAPFFVAHQIRRKELIKSINLKKCL